VGTRNIVVLATQTKLLSLNGGPLLVDTGDEDLDRELAGYARVVTGLGHSTMYKVAAAGEE
jgi:predicted polyphosphate/ATP-dependent NAD kinase